MSPSATDLRLRPLCASDEIDAIAAHEELAREQFEFLLDWRRDQPWWAYLQSLRQQRRGLELPPDRVRPLSTEILRQALVEGIDRVLVTCDDDNAASAVVIERAGAVLDDVR